MANSVQKEAKFFCQCCGAEVPRKSKFCPKCGKFFASVLCPNCGHTGKTSDFINGCPECGYAVNGSKTGNTNTAPDTTKNIKIKKNRFYLPLRNKAKKASSSDSELPAWVYLLCLVVLTCLVMGLYSCL